MGASKIIKTKRIGKSNSKLKNSLLKDFSTRHKERVN
jgi:hypothetical protein